MCFPGCWFSKPTFAFKDEYPPGETEMIRQAIAEERDMANSYYHHIKMLKEKAESAERNRTIPTGFSFNCKGKRVENDPETKRQHCPSGFASDIPLTPQASEIICAHFPF